MSRTLVGIDLGGTSIRAAVALAPGTHGDPVRRSTPAQEGPDAVLDACVEAALEASQGITPDGLAIGIPGPLDPERGVVYDAPHLPGFSGLEAARLLSVRLQGAPVAIENDAKLAAFAEYTSGAGRGADPFLYVTVSTGIGGGLVLGGELYHGLAGTAGELGHMHHSSDGPACGQGHRGCLEGFASGTGIAAQAAAAVAAGRETTLALLPGMGGIDARVVEEAARAGDALAREIYAATGRALGRALGGLINLLGPEVIAIGGGLINTGDLLFDPLHAAIDEIAFRVPRERCRVVPAALGTDAGLVGATAWALRRFGEG